jgi:hypothetical protein
MKQTLLWKERVSSKFASKTIKRLALGVCLLLAVILSSIIQTLADYYTWQGAGEAAKLTLHLMALLPLVLFFGVVFGQLIDFLLLWCTYLLAYRMLASMFLCIFPSLAEGGPRLLPRAIDMAAGAFAFLIAISTVQLLGWIRDSMLMRSAAGKKQKK